MILQALAELYEDLAAQGRIALPGWGPAKISYRLCLDGSGEPVGLMSCQQENEAGKLRPALLELPAAVKRAVNIAPNFLWDNPGYLLGVDAKGKPERTQKCFEASRQLHHEILDGADSPVARAILAFFDGWEPSRAQEPPWDGYRDALLSGVNLAFLVNGEAPEKDPAIRRAWQDHYDAGEGPQMQCLVTGKVGPAAAVHPAIQGVRDAQPVGAALVSFNAPAFCSYGREQSLNAPVSRYAAFAYTSALNWLLADKDNVQYIGDTTVVCWAKGADPLYQGITFAGLFGTPPPAGLRDNDLRSVMKRLASGLPSDGLALDPNRPFYVLGLAPNAARISVRFFLRDTFGAMIGHINAHHEAMSIAGPDRAEEKIVPLWLLLRETVNQKSRDKKPSPVLAGAVARAVFAGTAYPAALLEAVTLRIRAERDINWRKAGIIKAYYTRNKNDDCPEEVLKVSLNEESTNVPYNLGRLFAVYEAIQQAANPGINATIKDKYFNAAAATPAMIFHLLSDLSKKHLRKLPVGQRINYEKQIGQITDRLGEEYPSRLTLPQQGSFDLGYYHQTQKRYEKKEDK